ncbi:MAG: Rpn family recombination-promoting nuclease/putative transposase [Leptolyngbyaceae cyanobacterium MO_188.B28]|nr:Rpn family recombination-promoting nuclease/putative transposase [Leptolyngbyaceae cyanobacterium MO_188.B28]
MKTDSLFYRLFQSAPTLFFELIDQFPVQAERYVFRSVELKQTAFRIDGIFLPPPEVTKPRAYFVEVQFQKDEYLFRRLFAEVFLFLKQNPEIKDWQAVAIYPNRSIAPTDTEPYRVLLDSPRVQQICLDELGERQEVSMGLGLVRLVVEPEATAASLAKQLLTRSQQEVPAGLSRSAIIELIETIVVYKFPQLSRREIEAMLGLSDLKQTRVYQEALEEGERLGGKLEAKSLIMRQLTRKLGEIPQDLQGRIEELTLTQLENLGEALLDFEQMDDLVTWLAAHEDD